MMVSRNYLPPRAPLLLSAIGLLSFVTATLAAWPPALPNIPAYSTNVTQAPYNANGNGIATNTTAIQNAINDVSALGGGTVEIPGPGIYLTGPLTMKSKINLQIDPGATLRMLPMASWSGTSPLLSFSSLHDVEISGSGSIDGQGGGWWPTSAGSGLYMIYFTSCKTVLVQNVTVSNAPKQQIVFKSSKGGNITIQNIIIRAPSSHAGTPSHNTDGIDLVGTNCLIQNCDISTGDDNIALGTSSSGVPTADILVANCTFGDGHGMTIGSNTQGGVSNLTVINCTFNGTDCGIRMKSDNATSGGGGEGGIAQDLHYYNLGMTNIRYQPILIYSYYNVDSSPTGITPATAAGEPIGSSSFPIWQNIVISNITATVASGGEAGMIWGRTETPATNITLSQIHITAPANFRLYNVKGLQVVDSQISLTGGGNTFSIYNAQFTITNYTLATNVFSMDGLAGTNSLALYNTRATMSDSTAIGVNPLTLSASTLSNSASLALPATRVVNFVLGTNNATVAVAGILALTNTLNIATNSGFGPGTNTLFTYTVTLSGLPTLGSAPPGYNYAFDTNTARQVRLVITSTNASPTPTTTTNQSSANPSTYGTAVTFTATVSPAPTNGESVTFKDGLTTLGPGTLSGGQATFNTTATQLAAGAHSITAVYAGDGAYDASTSSVLTQTVNQLALTVSGLTISNKVYNKTIAATLNTNGYTLNTVIGGDAVTLVTNGYTATFASSNVANGINVTVTSLSLGGAQAANYTLTQPTGLTASITPLGLTVTGLTISNKVYDKTTAATLITNGYALNTVIGGDAVMLVTNGYTATFASSNVANGITVTVTNLALGGAQAGNYNLTQPTGLTANITPAGSSLQVGPSANPVAHLSSVSFTASVTPSTLSGSVLFLTNGIAFDSQTLSGGTATSVTTATLPRGTNTITAQYSGNTNYSPSTNTLSEVVTNNPPVANPAAYYRLVGYPLTIVITNLATNWSDLDGDKPVLAGVTTPSTNGGAVSFDSTNVYYSDSNDVTDQFGYTINDGQGGVAGGVVTVLMAQQNISGVTVNSDGSVTLSFSGIPGSTNWVETTTNLVPPVDWMPISTNVADTNGLWQFTDTQATNCPLRFYRSYKP